MSLAKPIMLITFSLSDNNAKQTTPNIIRKENGKGINHEIIIAPIIRYTKLLV